MPRSKRDTDEAPEVENDPKKAAGQELPANPQEAAIVEEEKRQAENAPAVSQETSLAVTEPTPETKAAADEEQRLADEGEAAGDLPDLPRTGADELADKKPTVAVDQPAETANPHQELLAQQAPHRNRDEAGFERDPTQPPSPGFDTDPGVRAAGDEVDAAGPAPQFQGGIDPASLPPPEAPERPKGKAGRTVETETKPADDNLAYEKLAEHIVNDLIPKVCGGGRDFAWARAALIQAQRMLPRRWTDYVDAANRGTA